MSAAAGLTIIPVVATTTTLAASATAAATGTSITFTATTTPASGTGVPTGTVTFLDGTTTLGTGTLTAGKATFATAALAIGTHSVTASYGGDPSDTASVSSSLSIVVNGLPDIAVTASPSSATIKAGGSATTVLSVQPANGYTGTTTFACTGLPAFATCSFSPPSVTTTGAVATTTLTIATNVATGALVPVPMLHDDSATRVVVAGSGIVLGLLLLPLALGRRQKTGRMPWLAIALLMLGAAGAHSGCGGSNVNVTPAGQTNVVITATSGSITKTVPFQLTIQ